MRADKKKLELAMAEACMNTEDLTRKANMPRPTVNNVVTGRNVRPATIGRIAKALGVSVAEIIQDTVAAVSETNGRSETNTSNFTKN